MMLELRWWAGEWARGFAPHRAEHFRTPIPRAAAAQSNQQGGLFVYTPLPHEDKYEDKYKYKDAAQSNQQGGLFVYTFLPHPTYRATSPSYVDPLPIYK